MALPAVPTANWTAWVPRNVSPGHRDGPSVYVQLGSCSAVARPDDTRGSGNEAAIAKLIG